MIAEAGLSALWIGAALCMLQLVLAISFLRTQELGSLIRPVAGQASACRQVNGTSPRALRSKVSPLVTAEMIPVPNRYLRMRPR